MAAKSVAKSRPNPDSRYYGRLIFLVLTIVVVTLAFAAQWPTLSQVFPEGDDSGYLFDGVRLVEQGVMMPLGSGPLGGILNGAIYLLFPRDHILLGAVSLVRRVILLAVLLLAAGLAGKAVGGRWTGLALMAAAAIARPVATVLQNSADGTYAALSGLSFAVLLLVWRAAEEKIQDLSPWGTLAAGGILGLAALARPDGLLLAVLLVPALWLLLGRSQLATRSAGIFAAGAAIPVLVYVLAFGIFNGRWDPELGARSYLAFEQGHNYLYAGRYDVVPSPSATDLYGTAEANGGSVPRAILNNPAAFAARVPLVLANASRMFSNAYSILGGVLFLFLAASGFFARGHGWNRALRILVPVWCIPLAGYLLASYRPGFFGTVFIPLLALAAAGLLPALLSLRAAWNSDGRPALAVTAFVLLGALAAQAQFVAEEFRARPARAEADRTYRTWLTELSANVPAGECVISMRTEDAVYSNHAVYGQWTIFFEVTSPEALRAEMQKAGCRYLVVGDELRQAAPGFAALAEQALSRLFDASDDAHTVYRLP